MGKKIRCPLEVSMLTRLSTLWICCDDNFGNDNGVTGLHLTVIGCLGILIGICVLIPDAGACLFGFSILCNGKLSLRILWVHDNDRLSLLTAFDLAIVLCA